MRSNVHRTVVIVVLACVLRFVCEGNCEIIRVFRQNLELDVFKTNAHADGIMFEEAITTTLVKAVFDQPLEYSYARSFPSINESVRSKILRLRSETVTRSTVHPAGINVTCRSSVRDDRETKVWSSSVIDNSGNEPSSFGLLVSRAYVTKSNHSAWAERIFASFANATTTRSNELLLLLAQKHFAKHGTTTLPDTIDASWDCEFRVGPNDGASNPRRKARRESGSSYPNYLVEQDPETMKRRHVRIEYPHILHDSCVSATLLRADAPGYETAKRRTRHDVEECVSLSQSSAAKDSSTEMLRAARRVERDDGTVMSALEMEDMVRQGIPGLDLMMKPILDTVLTPITSQLVSILTNEMGGKLSDALSSETGAKAPYQASTLINAQLTYALNGFLVDSVTHRVTQAMTHHAGKVLAPSVSQSVHRLIEPKLKHDLILALSDTLLDRMSQTVSKDVGRSLLMSMTEQLTRSVTHAVVPTLSQALAYDRTVDAACNSCFESGERCSLCTYAPTVSYYTNYYASYYSDYYSNYYADYFSEAVQRLDRDLYMKGKWTRAAPSILEFQKA